MKHRPWNSIICYAKKIAPYDLDADLRLHLAALVARPEPRFYLSWLVGQRRRSGDGDARMRSGYDCAGLRGSVDHDGFFGQQSLRSRS